MARVPIYNYFAVFLLVIALTCINADDTEDPEIDIETFGSRNQLLDSIFNDSLVLGEYLFGRSEELCEKLIDDEMYRNETSEELESRDAVVKNCRRRVVERLDPSGGRYGSKTEETLWHKYGLANIQKMVNQKYEEFLAEIVQRMDDYVKGLTPEQQTRTTARNLRMWSGKIKDAPTLSMKNLFYNSCMRFYYFERGV